MPQHRLEHYFPPSRAPAIPSGRNFLDLPQSARHLIYSYAGLAPVFVDLNYTNLTVFPKGAYPDNLFCRKLDADSSCEVELRKVGVYGLEDVWEFKHEGQERGGFGREGWGRAWGTHQGLFLASRQIHEEVEAFTYAGAVLRVCLGQPLGCGRLWRLSGNALGNLGSLTVRLGLPKTVVRGSGWVGSTLECVDLQTRPGRAVLKDWTETLEWLARWIRPGQLRLRVVFCAKTTGDVGAVLESVARLPRLKDCGMYVGWYDQSGLRKARLGDYNGSRYYTDKVPQSTDDDFKIPLLVDRVVRKLTVVNDRDPTPFRYLDLPQELRLLILSYTSLVSPTAVQWRPRTCINWVQSPTCTDYGHGLVADPGSGYCSGSCLHIPGPNIDESIGYPCCNNCKPEDHSTICYCSAQGLRWSSSCTCDFRRHALFSVSSQVRRDTISVYYTRNQIVITPYNNPMLRFMVLYEYARYSTGIPSLPKIELSLYLSSIDRTAFQHIHWLEWILPHGKPAYLLPNTPAWFDYLDTLLLMQHAMNLTALTFTISISEPKQSIGQYGYSQTPRDDAWTWYKTIVSPVRRLGEAGLKNFFVYLRDSVVCDARRARIEQELEGLVMGKGYDSRKKGKPAERMSRLLEEVGEREER